MTTKINNLTDYAKLANQKISQLETEVVHMQEAATQSEEDKTAFLGITFMDTNDVEFGLKIESVYAGTPAEEVGLKAGDFIIAIDGEKIDSGAKLSNIMTAHSAGDTIQIKIATVEEGKIVNKTVDVTLGLRGDFDLED